MRPLILANKDEIARHVQNLKRVADYIYFLYTTEAIINIYISNNKMVMFFLSVDDRIFAVAIFKARSVGGFHTYHLIADNQALPSRHLCKK